MEGSDGEQGEPSRKRPRLESVIPAKAVPQTIALGPEKSQAQTTALLCSVVDLDTVGSATFGRIRIQKKNITDPDPEKNITDPDPDTPDQKNEFERKLLSTS